MRAQHLIDTLGLQPHPEGGWYREVFRSSEQVTPADGRAPRQALTSIYFLLEAGQHSRWHRVLSDEVWVHLEGATLALWTCDAAMHSAPLRTRVGPVDDHGTRPQHVVRAGEWQAAQPMMTEGISNYSLAACMVAPGFDFADFSLMAPDGAEAARLRLHGPEFAALI